jgi:hypothetical protein
VLFAAHTAIMGAQDESGRWRVKANEFQLSIAIRNTAGMKEDLRYSQSYYCIINTSIVSKACRGAYCRDTEFYSEFVSCAVPAPLFLCIMQLTIP